MNFESIVYADDLNTFKYFPNFISDAIILSDLNDMQISLHSWGQMNLVNFDSFKESMHILSDHKPAWSNFRILGCIFDCKLIMHDCVHETVLSANWKMRMLLRTHRFYTSRDMINLYKAHILSYIEYRTPVLLHASHSVLIPLDMIQNRFLSNNGITIEDTALHFKLLPLRQRRQIAALGVIQRTVLKKGPEQF